MLSLLAGSYISNTSPVVCSQLYSINFLLVTQLASNSHNSNSTSTMALTNDAQPFRFMDLPGEIRNKVYGFLLCAFDEAPEEYDPGDYLLACPTRNFTFVTHSVDTAILCTNSKIHREAYDFMVKTNRFVRVSCLRGLPIITMLRIHRVPVVTVQRSLEHFKGLVSFIQPL